MKCIQFLFPETTVNQRTNRGGVHHTQDASDFKRPSINEIGICWNPMAPHKDLLRPGPFFGPTRLMIRGGTPEIVTSLCMQGHHPMIFKNGGERHAATVLGSTIVKAGWWSLWLRYSGSVNEISFGTRSFLWIGRMWRCTDDYRRALKPPLLLCSTSIPEWRISYNWRLRIQWEGEWKNWCHSIRTQTILLQFHTLSQYNRPIDALKASFQPMRSLISILINPIHLLKELRHMQR